MLRILKLRKQKELAEEQLRNLIAKDEEFKTRAEELNEKINNAKSDEELEAIDEEMNTLTTEKEQHEEKKKNLEEKIEEIDEEIEELEAKNTPDEENRNKKENKKIERGFVMTKKHEIRELVKLPHIREFLGDVADLVRRSEKGLEKVDLTIPQEIIDVITDDLGKYSVLYNEVRVEKLTGKGRAIVTGECPEAVWTEMTGSINELKAKFSEVEVDGFKLAGFFRVHISHIEDSFVNLAELVINLLKEAIGIALDKAILYGKGTTGKQPEGIVNKFTTEKQGEIYKTAKNKTTLKDFILAKGSLDRGVSNRGEVIYVMNEKTWNNQVLPLSLATNNAGAYVTASQGRMPATGDRVVLCNLVQDNIVVVGDFKKYLLAQRNEMTIKRSDEVGFLEDQVVFKGTQRFDGKPYRLGAFNVMLLEGKESVDEVTFAEDTANN